MIDLNDTGFMNRFHAIDDPKVAGEIVKGIIDGKEWPEVTLWRLYDFTQNALVFGRLIGEGKVKDPNGFSR